MNMRDSSVSSGIPLKLKVFFIPAVIIILSAFQAPHLDSSSKIKVVTSVFPLMEFARAVCGERGRSPCSFLQGPKFTLGNQGRVISSGFRLPTFSFS